MSEDGDEKDATSLPKSGVVPHGLVADAGAVGAPPFSVVIAYLTRGEHAAWVEAYAARSRAFADVLTAMRNDHDERADAPRPARAVRSRR